MEEYFKNGNIVSANDLNVIRDAALTTRADMNSFVQLQTQNINNVGTASAEIDSQGRLVLSNFKGNTGDTGPAPTLNFYEYSESKSYVNYNGNVDFVSYGGNMYVPAVQNTTAGYNPDNHPEQWLLVVQRGAAGQGGNIVIENYSDIKVGERYYVKINNIVGDQVTANLVKGDELVDIEKTFNQFEVITGYGEDECAIKDTPTLATVHTIQGNTGRESENLFDPNVKQNNDYATATIQENGAKIIVTGPYYCGFKHPLYKGDYYVNFIAVGETSNIAFYKGGSLITSIATSGTISLSEDITDIYIYSSNSDVSKTTTYYGLTISKENVSYKPYNPTLLNARGKVISTGNNLYSGPQHIKINRDGEIITKEPIFLPSGTYTIKCDSVPYVSGGYSFTFYDENNAPIVQKSAGLNNPVTFTLNKTARYLTIYVNTAGTYRITLNYGSTFLPYEPYKENEYLIPELGAFDTLDVASGTITRQTSDYITLDGSDDEEYVWTDVEKAIQSNNEVKKGFDYYAFVKTCPFNASFRDSGYNRLQFGGVNFPLPNYGITDVNSWRNYIRKNPITLVYKLATPTTEKIDISSAYEVVKGGLQRQELNIQKPFTINRSYAVSLNSQINASVNAIAENKDSIIDINERLNLNEKVDKKLVNSNRAIITGYTGGEEQLALPDTTFVEIDKIQGQTQKASDNLCKNFRFEGGTQWGAAYSFINNLTPNTTYTIHFKTKNTGAFLYLNERILTEVQYFYADGKGYRFVVKTRPDMFKDSTLIKNAADNTGKVDSSTIYDFQILLGDRSGDIPPYKPFDDSLVNSNCKIVSTGKNLFSGWRIGQTLDENNGKVKPSSTGAVSDYIRIDFNNYKCWVYNLNPNLYSFVSFYDKNKSYIDRTGAGGVEKYEFDKIQNFGATYIRITQYENVNVTGKIDELKQATTMLSYDTSKRLPYEPYQSNEYVVNQPLGEWDSIDVKSGTMTKQTSEVITLNGSESYITEPTSDGNRFYYTIPNISTVEGTKNYIDSSNLKSVQTSTGVYFYPPIKTMNYEEWRIWLEKHPFKLVYKLKTPTTTKVDLPSGYAITKGGMQIQEPKYSYNLPYILTKSYALSLPSQVNATINAVAENKDYIDNTNKQLEDFKNRASITMLERLRNQLANHNYLSFVSGEDWKSIEICFGYGNSKVQAEAGEVRSFAITYDIPASPFNTNMQIIPFVNLVNGRNVKYKVIISNKTDSGATIYVQFDTAFNDKLEYSYIAFMYYGGGNK